MGNLGLDVTESFTNLPPQTPGAISERAPPTPWHDDYEMAPSVGPVRLHKWLSIWDRKIQLIHNILQLDEQLADETYEQFEERVVNKRAAAMYNLVRAKMQLNDTIPFTEMAFRNNKKQVCIQKNVAYLSYQCIKEIIFSRLPRSFTLYWSWRKTRFLSYHNPSLTLKLWLHRGLNLIRRPCDDDRSN